MLFHQRRHAAQDLLVDPLLHFLVGAQAPTERLNHRGDALVQRRGAAIVLGGEPLAQFGPQAADVAAERVALERLVAQAVDAIAQRVVALQPPDEIRDEDVEALAQLVVLVMTHFGDLLHRHLDDLERRAIVELEPEPVRERLEERRALRHLAGDVGLRLALRQHVVQRAQRRVQ